MLQGMSLLIRENRQGVSFLGTAYHVLFIVFSFGIDVIKMFLRHTYRLDGLTLQCCVAIPISLHSMYNYYINFSREKKRADDFDMSNTVDY